MASRINYNNPDSTGALGLPYHYEMVADEKRVIPFKRAINEVCKGKIVLESGAGSAIMSILAAKAGAKRVYAVEIDPIVAAIARENIEGSGFDNITLIQKSTLDVTPEDLDNLKAEVVIAENLSTWQITEPQIKIMNYINKYLAEENVVCLPAHITNILELAESKYVFEGIIHMKTHFFEFSGIRPPKLLSEKKIFNKINMLKINPLLADNAIEVAVTEDGTLNSLRLTSPVTIYKGIEFEQSDSLMPPVIVPLQNSLRVRRGQVLQLRIRYESNTRWEEFYCSVL